jgi:hypothetical protein
VSFDRETAISAVRNAAREIGTETLLPDQYTAFRNRLLNGANGLKRQRLETRWPAVALIQADGWETTLESAELKRTDADFERAVDNPDAMGLYLECRGCIPSIRAAVEFLRNNGVSARRPTMKTKQALEVLRERRNLKWTPSRALQDHERPDVPEACRALEKAKLASYKPARKIQPPGWWMNEERMIEGLKFAMSKLEPGESLTQVNLRRLAKENRGLIPAPSKVTEFAKRNGTSLPELRERARRSLSELGD